MSGHPYFEEMDSSYYHPSQKDTESFYIRKKRQFNFDQMAKHVEILIAYDDSIKEFHSDIDIKSYILTLFSYVSLTQKQKIKVSFCSGFIFIFRCKYWK